MLLATIATLFLMAIATPELTLHTLINTENGVLIGFQSIIFACQFYYYLYLKTRWPSIFLA
jgi:hypothetical protein